MVRRDPLQTNNVDIACLELGVQNIEVRDIFVNQTLDMRAVTKIVGVGFKKDVIAGDAFLPFKGSGTDRCVVIGGCVAVGFRTEKMFRGHEGGSKDRRIGRKGLLHLPGDFRRGHDGQVTDEFMSGLAPRPEIRIDEKLKCELDIFGGKRLSIVPLDVVTKLDFPIETIGGNTAVFDCWDLRC
ncbi:hypothetical protein D3C86_1453530 [compost metagenome]